MRLSSYCLHVLYKKESQKHLFCAEKKNKYVFSGGVFPFNLVNRQRGKNVKRKARDWTSKILCIIIMHACMFISLILRIMYLAIYILSRHRFFLSLQYNQLNCFSKTRTMKMLWISSIKKNTAIPMAFFFRKVKIHRWQRPTDVMLLTLCDYHQYNITYSYFALLLMMIVSKFPSLACFIFLPFSLQVKWWESETRG